MKTSFIIFGSVVAITLLAATAAGAGERWEVRDRDGKLTHTIRPGSGSVMDATIHDRSGRKVGTIRAPSGPVMNHWTVKDRSGKTVGRIRPR